MKRLGRAGAAVSWVLCLGVMVALAACEKDGVGRGSEGKVAVHFTISSAGYEADGVRAMGAKVKPERVSVYLGEGVYMRAKLVPDEEEEMGGKDGEMGGGDGRMRAVTTSSLVDNQKVWMAAFDPADSYNQVGITAKYHFSESLNRLVLDEWDKPLEVEPNKTYYFAAFSYYKSTAALSETDIHPNSDLIWDSTSKEITETEAGRTVSMVLKHKFSRVRVKLDASGITGATISALGTVQVTGGKTADLDLQTGDLTETATGVTQTVDNWYPALSTATTWSDYVPFYSTPASVTISSVTLTVNSTAHAYSNRTANFSQALAPGQSYTLVVDFDRLVWARSNIVWDNANSKLTFAVTAADNASIPANVQGLAFKWGSLVALSITRTAMNNTVAVYSSGNITYSPSGNKSYAWSALPYISDVTSPFDNGDWKEDDLSTYNNNTGFDVTAQKGDICRYITAQGWVTGSWRTPTTMEQYDLITEAAVVKLGTNNGYGGSSLPQPGDGGGIYGRGEWQMTSGWLLGSGATTGVSISNPSVGVFFPYSGYIRDHTGVFQIIAGGAGYYSSSSSSTNYNGSWLALSVVLQLSDNYSARIYNPSVGRDWDAYTVRCVRID